MKINYVQKLFAHMIIFVSMNRTYVCLLMLSVVAFVSSAEVGQTIDLHGNAEGKKTVIVDHNT